MAVFSEAFASVEVTAESTLFDLGANSLDLLRLMNQFQQKFDVLLDVVDMFSAENVGELVQLVESRRPVTG